MKDILKKIDSIKAKIDAHRPMDSHMVKQLREYFRIGMTYTSNALEGNSLTDTETNIKELHRLFYYRIDASQAGKYRKQKVIITGTDFIPPAPDKISDLMESFVDGIPGIREKNHPVEFA